MKIFTITRKWNALYLVGSILLLVLVSSQCGAQEDGAVVAKEEENSYQHQNRKLICNTVYDPVECTLQAITFSNRCVAVEAGYAADDCTIPVFGAFCPNVTLSQIACGPSGTLYDSICLASQIGGWKPANCWAPTLPPTKAPTKLPTKAPTKAPTKVPTKAPASCLKQQVTCQITPGSTSCCSGLICRLPTTGTVRKCLTCVARMGMCRETRDCCSGMTCTGTPKTCRRV